MIKGSVLGKTLNDRFFQKVAKSDGCWIWTGTRDNKGYGCMRIQYRWHKAHRLSYAWFVGLIPDGLLVCHKCDNPPCVNPDHFFIGTNQDNMDDMRAKGRAPCVVGERNPRNILNARQVLEIRGRDDAGYKRLAEEYGVSKSCIRDIKVRKNWNYL